VQSRIKSRSHSATPTGVAGLIKHDTGCGDEAAVFVVGDGSAVLQVQENVVPGVSDLTGEEADRVDAGIRTVEIAGGVCPAQAFCSEPSAVPMIPRFASERAA
jgi:hypothetical protein